MRKLVSIMGFSLLLSTFSVAFNPQQNGRARLDQIEQSLRADVPRLLCLTNSFATGAQPSDQAFGKLAANGFRSILNLRTAAEEVDLEKEGKLVAEAGMRYFNVPVASNAPRAEQADEFIRVVKEKANHPMLIHCASANRVGAFMMIYRVVEQGWSEEKALEEATRIGLRSAELKKFAQGYISRRKAKD